MDLFTCSPARYTVLQLPPGREYYSIRLVLCDSNNTSGTTHGDREKQKEKEMERERER